MIAVDTHVLVYAHRVDSPHHEAAGSALSDLVGSGGLVGVPWPCVHEFVAIATHPRVYDPPSSIDQAWDAVDALLAHPRVRALAEAADHAQRLRSLTTSAPVVGPRVHDARIAAICLSHGVSELWTADRDFSYFPSLRTRNPMVNRA